MEAIEFHTWPKIPRLFRPITITEKIDGTNGAIGVVELDQDEGTGVVVPDEIFHVVQLTDLSADPPNTVRYFGVYAQSRSRLTTPTMDNHGFARWVSDNGPGLVSELGPGLHFGEWWGSGIYRGYGLPKGENRFSLFNTKRWNGFEFSVPGLGLVPILYQGPFNIMHVHRSLDFLACAGSVAAPGFPRPEGVVVYHGAANHCFKVTLENDESPKSAAG